MKARIFISESWRKYRKLSAVIGVMKKWRHLESWRKLLVAGISASSRNGGWRSISGGGCGAGAGGESSISAAQNGCQHVSSPRLNNGGWQLKIMQRESALAAAPAV